MIATVVGFPHGSHTTVTKEFETEELIGPARMRSTWC